MFTVPAKNLTTATFYSCSY